MCPHGGEQEHSTWNIFCKCVCLLIIYLINWWDLLVLAFVATAFPQTNPYTGNSVSFEGFRFAVIPDRWYTSTLCTVRTDSFDVSWPFKSLSGENFTLYNFTLYRFFFYTPFLIVFIFPAQCFAREEGRRGTGQHVSIKHAFLIWLRFHYIGFKHYGKASSQIKF